MPLSPLVSAFRSLLAFSSHEGVWTLVPLVYFFGETSNFAEGVLNHNTNSKEANKREEQLLPNGNHFSSLFRSLSTLFVCVAVLTILHSSASITKSGLCTHEPN